jgi:hypothetical protein
MDSKLLIGICVMFNLVVSSRVMQLYIWPRLRTLSQKDALNALLIPHMFRFAGLSFLMPGVVSPDLNPAFAYPAAFGDLAAAALAIVASFALTARTSWALAAVWLFNLEGTFDLLFAYYNGVIGLRLPPGVMGAAVYIPTVFVPFLLVCHFMTFRLLLRGQAQISKAGESSAVPSR